MLKINRHDEDSLMEVLRHSSLEGVVTTPVGGKVEVVTKCFSDQFELSSALWDLGVFHEVV